MFIVKSQLTNVKATRNDEGTLTTTPTDGNMRLSPKATEIIGVASGDYLLGVSGEDENGNEVFAVAKGSAGTDDSSPEGAKLASASNKPGSSLNFSSSNFYSKLGGGQGKNISFTVQADKATEVDGVTYYPLAFNEAVEPTMRKRKNADGVEEEVEEEEMENA